MVAFLHNKKINLIAIVFIVESKFGSLEKDCSKKDFNGFRLVLVKN